MTRALLALAWVSGVIAWAGAISIQMGVFIGAGIISAAATLAWGYRLHPEDPTRQDRSIMPYAYDNDTLRDLARDAARSDREERRDAQRHAPPDSGCYQHHWVNDHNGGGRCTQCGETVSAAEL